MPALAKRGVPLIGLTLALAAAAPAASAAIAAEAPLGIWQNPAGTVRVRTNLCSGGTLCGRVIWATAGAIADAQAGGTRQLIGTELMHDYRPSGPGLWRGRVYVPDMGATFFSRISQIDGDHVRVSGCILGGLLCKSQIWTRPG